MLLEGCTMWRFVWVHLHSGENLFFQILFISQLAILCVICSKGFSQSPVSNGCLAKTGKPGKAAIFHSEFERSCTFHCCCTAGCRYAHSKLEGLKKGVFAGMWCFTFCKACQPFDDSWCFSFCWLEGWTLVLLYISIYLLLYVCQNFILRIAVYSMICLF